MVKLIGYKNLLSFKVTKRENLGKQVVGWGWCHYPLLKSDLLARKIVSLWEYVWRFGGSDMGPQGPRGLIYAHHGLDEVG